MRADELHAPATICRMTRAQFVAQLAQAPGTTITVPIGRGYQAHPTLAPVCRCPKPIDDDGTCVHCGRNTER